MAAVAPPRAAPSKCRDHVWLQRDQSKGFEGRWRSSPKSSGITIKFTDASQSFDTLIRPRVQGNNPPDIALFPQPGLMGRRSRASSRTSGACSTSTR